MLAAFYGHGSVVELLLSNGADPYLRNIVSHQSVGVIVWNETVYTLQRGDTAYDWARKQGHTQIYQRLIS